MKSLFIRILNRIGLLQYLYLKINFSFYGVNWVIPFYNSNGFSYAYSNSETHMFKLYQKLFEKYKPNVFIDIGVNIGQTLIKIKSISKEIKYFGYEPNFNCLSYVSEIIDLNNLSSTCELVPVGIGSKNAIMKFYKAGKSDTRGSVLRSAFENNENVKASYVPIFKLDHNHLELENKSVIIKIDVEGFELDALKGILNIIKSFQPIIVFEVLPHYNNKEKLFQQNQIIDFINNLNYKIYRISSDNGSYQKVNNLKYLNDFNENENDFLAIFQNN